MTFNSLINRYDHYYPITMNYSFGRPEQLRSLELLIFLSPKSVSVHHRNRGWDFERWKSGELVTNKLLT